MAQETNADEEQSETDAVSVQKDVTIIGYAADPNVDERDFAARFDPEGRDFHEREESTRERHYVRHYDDEEHEWVEEYISESAYEVLFESSAFVPDNDDNVELKRDVEHNVTHVRRPEAAVEAVITDIYHELEAPEGLHGRDYAPKFQDPDTWEDHITFEDGYVEEQRILTHQSERGSDDRFESEEAYPAFSITVHMEGSEAEVEEWSESIVGDFMNGVAALDGVGKVRLSDCTERVEKEGDCFEAL